MKAKYLDEDIECPICYGSGDDPADSDTTYNCRMCDGREQINRYGKEEPGPHGGENIVILNAYLEEDTDMLHVQSMPISDKMTGGFDERYGPEEVDDITNPPISNYQQDMKDRLQNKLGENLTNGKYEMPNEEPYFGKSYSEEDLDGQEWPEDNPDLDIDFIVSWLEARGDSYTMSIFDSIRDQRDVYNI